MFLDFVRDNGHGALLEGMLNRHRTIEDLSMEERRQGGVLPHSWHVPSSTEYYATVTSPKRYHERLGEAGIDFAVLYPTMGIALLQLLDDEQRITLCRLYNEFMAEQYRPLRRSVHRGGADPDEHARRSGRGAGARQGAGVEGGVDRQPRAPPAAG